MSDIEKALLEAYTTLGPGWDTQFENVGYAPPSKGNWARVTFQPNTPTVETLGITGLDLADGIFQIDLNVPLDTGTKALNDAAVAIRNIFKAGASFTYNGQAVRVKRCGRSSGRPVDVWYRISVTVYWFAFIHR